MRLFGSLLVILAAACFGFLGLFGSWASGKGVSVEMMLFLRFAIAGAVMTIIMFSRGERWPRGKLLLGLIGMGGILYVGEAMFWFHSAQHIPAGMTSLLLYIYPVFVTLFAWLFLKEKFNRSRIIALGLACAGLVLTIGPAIVSEAGSDRHDTSHAAVGIIFGLLCCVSYAIYILYGGGQVKRAGAIPAATVVIVSAAVVLGGVAIVRGDAFPTSASAWTGIVCLAVFSTLIAITAVLYGLHAIGPVQTSTLSTLEPVVTVLVGWMLMGDRLSIVQVIGGALIVIAAIVIARSAAGDQRPQHLSTDVAEIH